MALTAITDQIISDIAITRERYKELLIAEHDCFLLKEFLREKAKAYSGISHSELKVLYDLYFCADNEGGDE